MANIQQIIDYSMYVIGETESNWNWRAAAEYGGATISLGMMQCYGMNGRDLLARLNPSGEYNSISASLRNDIENLNLNWDWWASRSLNQQERDTAAAALGSDTGKTAQILDWQERASSYIDGAVSIGMSLDHPREIIYYMSMRHQSPAACNAIMATAGGTATLDRIHSIRNNDKILGSYDSRYDTNYNRLLAWDGISSPPDFGQIIPPIEGGDIPGISQKQPSATYINEKDGSLYLHGLESFTNGLAYNKASGQNWIPAAWTGGAPIDNGHTDDPATPAGVQAVIDKMRELNNTLEYGQGAGRLTPDISGYSDCSALISWLYRTIAGIITGTWTGDMLNYGTIIQNGDASMSIDANNTLPGDGVLVDRGSYNSSYDHVSLIMDDGTIWGHGFAPGPHLESRTIASHIANQGASRWEVRRWT